MACFLTGLMSLSSSEISTASGCVRDRVGRFERVERVGTVAGGGGASAISMSLKSSSTSCVDDFDCVAGSGFLVFSGMSSTGFEKKDETSTSSRSSNFGRFASRLAGLFAVALQNALADVL